MKLIRQLLLFSLLVCPALRAGQTRLIYPFQEKFFKAVKQNDAALVQSLIEDKNIYINMQDDTDSTPLHHAVTLNITEITKILLNNGAALSIKDDAGLTPLHLAMNRYIDKKKNLRKQRITNAHPSTEIIKLLIDETNINIQDNNNNTYLSRAFHPFIPIEIFRLIIKAGASPKIPNGRGILPLQQAASSPSENNTEMVKLLIEAGADPNSQQSTGRAIGRTPLHSAVIYYPKIDTVQLLLELGADPNIPDNRGRTALQITQENNLTEIEQLLIDAGATE